MTYDFINYVSLKIVVKFAIYLTNFTWIYSKYKIQKWHVIFNRIWHIWCCHLCQIENCEIHDILDEIDRWIYTKVCWIWHIWHVIFVKYILNFTIIWNIYRCHIEIFIAKFKIYLTKLTNKYVIMSISSYISWISQFQFGINDNVVFVIIYSTYTSIMSNIIDNQCNINCQLI